MGKIYQYSRQLQHRLSTPGLEPTVAPNDDHTGGSWSATDIYTGELCVNVNDDRVFVRTNNGILEITTMGTMSLINPIWEYLGGDISVGATWSTYPINPYVDKSQALGSLTSRWQGVTTDQLAIFGASAGYSGSEWVYLQDNIQTTNATTAYFGEIMMDDNEMISVEARINGFKSDYSKAYASTIFGTFYKTGSIVYSIDESDVIEKYNFTSTTSDLVISGTAGCRFSIKGESATNINWVVSYNYHKTINNV